MKYIIQCRNKNFNIVQYCSKDRKSLWLTKFLEDAGVYTDPEDFYKLEETLDDDWTISMVQLFEPHAAQYYLTKLLSL